MTREHTTLRAAIRARLDEVLDPCSMFTEKPQSVVELGLIDGVAIEDREVTVDLLPTNQLCVYVPHMADEIEDRVGDLPEVDAVSVETVADKVWTQDRMTDEAYEERTRYFEHRIDAHDVTPAYDGEEWTEDVAIESGATNE